MKLCPNKTLFTKTRGGLNLVHGCSLPTLTFNFMLYNAVHLTHLCCLPGFGPNRKSLPGKMNFCKVRNRHEGRFQKSHSCLPENDPHPALPLHFHQVITGGHLHWTGCTFTARQTWESDWSCRAQRYSQWFVLVSRERCRRLWLENLGQSCDPYWKWKQMTKQNQSLKPHTWGRRLPCLMCVFKAHLFVEVIIRKAGYH